MTTLQERYCAAQHCGPEKFSAKLFWRCLHRHAWPLALIRPEFFTLDRELIAQAGRVRNLRELNGEIRDFIDDGRNRTWWRGRLHVRISTHRLRAVARQYLTTKAPLPLESSRQRAA